MKPCIDTLVQRIRENEEVLNRLSGTEDSQERLKIVMDFAGAYVIVVNPGGLLNDRVMRVAEK